MLRLIWWRTLTWTPFLSGHQIIITLILLALLGGVFLRGFKEAISVAVILVAIYLVLNVVVITAGIAEVIANPSLVVRPGSADLCLYNDRQHHRTP